MESSRVESSLISGGSIWKDESKTFEARYEACGSMTVQACAGMSDPQALSLP